MPGSIQSVSLQPGGKLVGWTPGFTTAGGTIYGIKCSNFSGAWLWIQGTDLFIPPYTRGWSASVLPGVQNLTIVSVDKPYGVELSAALGNTSKITAYDYDIGDSPGASVLDQVIPVLQKQVNLNIAGQTVSPFVTGGIGRIRIYQISAWFDFGHLAAQPWTCSILFYVTTIGLLMGDKVGGLMVSPGSPSDSRTISAPGFDLPIGYDLSVSSGSDKDAAGGYYEPAEVTATVRYSIL